MGGDEERVVDAEVVEPARRSEPRLEREPTFYHPLSGAIILGVDWLAFGGDLASGFALVLLVSVAAFAVTYGGVYAVQTRFRGDPPSKARLKALIGAAAAGVPFPVTGTIVGAAILMLSGLPGGLKSLGRRR